MNDVEEASAGNGQAQSSVHTFLERRKYNACIVQVCKILKVCEKVITQTAGRLGCNTALDSTRAAMKMAESPFITSAPWHLQTLNVVGWNPEWVCNSDCAQVPIMVTGQPHQVPVPIQMLPTVLRHGSLLSIK